MQICNFVELINAKVINPSSLSRLDGFCTNLANVKKAYAFFTEDEEQALEAIKNGAYAIISTKVFKIQDKDVEYLQVNDLEKSLKRLLDFIDIKAKVYLLDDLSIECLKRLNYKALENNLLKDFDSLINDDFVFSNCSNYLKDFDFIEPEYTFEVLKNSSFFYQDLILNNEYFPNVFIPVIFTKAMAKLHAIKELNINFSNIKLLDYVFLNEFNDIVKMNEAYKVVFFEHNDLVINEIKKHLELVTITDIKSYKYMLYQGDKANFLKTLEDDSEGLF